MSLAFKSFDIDSQYKKILKIQKDLIQKNKYVRELEQQYHKPNKKYIKIPAFKKISRSNQTQKWPIESTMFTRLLKSRLDNTFVPKNLTPELKPSKSSSFRPRGNLRSISNNSKLENYPEELQINLTNSKISSRQGSKIGKNFWAKKKFKNLSYDSPRNKYFRKPLDNSFTESYENNLDEVFCDLQVTSISRYY